MCPAAEVSPSGGTLTASSPKAMDDAEVLSRRTFPGQGEVEEAVMVAAGHMGEQIPLEIGNRGHIQFAPQPNTIPEAHTAPESGKQPPLKEIGRAHV